MAFIKFADKNILVQVSVIPKSEHIVRIINSPWVDVNGFRLYIDRDGTYPMDNGEYKAYTTLYRMGDGWYELSDDESVYVEPETVPEPEPYKPTPEELAERFAHAKAEKIAISNKLLEEYLEAHPLQSNCHGGKIGTYSVTKDKQTLMSMQYTSYMLEKQVTGKAKLTWNESGKSCEEWTEDEFVTLLLQIKAYVYPLVARQQIYEEQITDCTTQDDLDNIVIAYGGADENH